jgi:putative membrane protein
MTTAVNKNRRYQELPEWNKNRKGRLSMKRYIFSIAILGTVSLLSAFSDAVAQQPQQHQKHEKRQVEQQTQQTVGALSRSDKNFMTRAAQDGMAEVALAELGTRQASNEEVKQFAQRMVDDHSKANNELRDMASKKGITLPSEMQAKHKSVQDRLGKLSGADFDREFMRAMVKDHDSAVALFEKQARTGSDPELKVWAEKTLSTLREHQKIARDLAGKVGAKTS